MERQKFTDQEIEQIQQIQQNAQIIFRNMGQLQFQKKVVEAQIKQVEQTHSDLIKSETDLIDGLRQKYGEGSLDLSTFEFIPDEKQNS